MQFLPRIKQQTGAVLNITTGGGPGMPVEERIAATRAIRPEMCTLNMGSMNFGILGGIGADPDNLSHMKRIADKLFGKDYHWSNSGRRPPPDATRDSRGVDGGQRAGGPGGQSCICHAASWRPATPSRSPRFAASWSRSAWTSPHRMMRATCSSLRERPMSGFELLRVLLYIFACGTLNTSMVDLPLASSRCQPTSASTRARQAASFFSAASYGTNTTPSQSPITMS